jgi:hypothetical protein
VKTLTTCRAALGRGAQWRYLLLFVGAMLVPAALAFAPVASFLGSLLDHSPRAAALVGALDSAAFSEVLRQLAEPAAAPIWSGLQAAALAALLLAPALAGASVAMARAPEPLRVRALLAGAGEQYPRMLRMLLVAAIPMGVAGVVGAVAFHVANGAADRAVHEASADRATAIAGVVTGVFVWLAHVTLEAGRAHFATDPERRSAFLAWWSGVRLVVRRPGPVFALSAVTSIVAVGGATLVTALRYRLPQTGPATIAVAFVIGQVAIAVLAWGRSSRIAGLAALIRADE